MLEPVDSKKSFSMPPESHSSASYIVLDKVGVFHQYVEYNKDHLPIFEIGYHFESRLSKQGPVLHVHEYTAPGIEHRLHGRNITPEEKEKYKKYFKGVDLR